jgi:DNA replication protein DnaC
LGSYRAVGADRFLHHCHVIAVDGESYRVREARNVITPA